jgi:hypothetical protein
MSVVDIEFPGNLAQVASLTDLRAIPSFSAYDGAAYLVAGSGLFTFDPSSLAADDGSSTIKPNGITPQQAGRWVLSGGGIVDGFRAMLATASGSGLVGFTPAATSAQHLAAYATPVDFGGADDTARLRAMLSSGKKLIMIPEGDYLITSTITIPAETKIIACAGALFRAGTPNLTMFITGDSTFGTQWQGGKFFANGLGGVIFFDLTGFRHAAEIAHTWMEGCSVGIYARSLCWDTAFRSNFMTSVVDGFVIGEGSNAVTIDHPGISGFTSTGITILPGTGPLPTVGHNILGGYVQGGPVGVLDKGRSTSIDGTYFEECTDADISWSGAIMPIIQRSYHSSTGGRVCLQGRGTAGGQANNIVLQGDRSVGLFDFDTSNTYCRAEISRTATDNLMIGTVDGIHIARRLGGAQEPGDIGWDGTERVYVVQGTGPGNYIMRTVANGFDDVAVGAGLEINALRKEGMFYQLVTGGEAFTFTNLRDGQTVTLLIKAGAASPAGVTVAGTALDMTGVAEGKRKVVHATLIGADSNTVWIDESPWK